MSVAFVQVCERFNSSGNCSSSAWVQSYILPPDYQPGLLSENFDPALFQTVFNGMLLLFAIGLSIGLVFAMIKRSPWR